MFQSWNQLVSIKNSGTKGISIILVNLGCGFIIHEGLVWCEYVSFKKYKKYTLSSLSSFPAKANNNVVFPELGGPKSNVILQTCFIMLDLEKKS